MASNIKIVKSVPITPRLLREEAKKVRKYMREPGVAPWVLEWMARIIEVGDLNLKLHCPKCGKVCYACNGAHAAYDGARGRMLRIVIVDYMCPDCPHIWAHWQNVPEEEEKTNDGESSGEKPTGEVRSSADAADQEPSGGRVAPGASDR